MKICYENKKTLRIHGNFNFGFLEENTQYQGSYFFKPTILHAETTALSRSVKRPALARYRTFEYKANCFSNDKSNWLYRFWQFERAVEALRSITLPMYRR